MKFDVYMHFHDFCNVKYFLTNIFKLYLEIFLNYIWNIYKLYI